MARDLGMARDVLVLAHVESTSDKGTVAASAAAPSSSATPRRGRILVVDDDLLVGISLRRVLLGHDVTAVTDAREARDRIQSGERYDVIFCDLQMPNMTGMDLHAELSQLPGEQADKMIFITGGAFTPTASAFLDRVSNDRLEKPFDTKGLRALVQRFLR
jgi:CheY-like chemotaxis protein